MVRMQEDIRRLHLSALASECDDAPPLISYEKSGSRGRPSIRIDRNFLESVSGFMGQQAIARFVGVNKRTVVRELERYGLVHARTRASFVTDEGRIDELVERVYRLFPTYGSRLIKAAIKEEHTLNVSLKRILDSMERLGLSKQPFGRRNIRRRPYRVPGPNSLWHHDGQHGMRNLFLSGP